MALNPFTAGFFSTFGDCVEWDGTNEGEILDWIHGRDPLDPGLDEASRWQIAATIPNLVLVAPPSHPMPYGSRKAVVPPGFWVSATVGPTISMVVVQVVDPAGKWKSTDPYGRPGTPEDIVAPPPPQP